MVKDVALLFKKNDWTLVYGASSEGLMGECARQLVDLGGKVHGVIPRLYLKFEPTNDVPDIGENEIVADLHSQKARMAQISDAFLFLPGGFGTFEEFATYTMWAKLGTHSLPIVLYNFDGYYDYLVKWFDVVFKEGFASQEYAQTFSVINKLEDLEDSLAKYSYVPLVVHDISDIAPIGVVGFGELRRTPLAVTTSDPPSPVM